MPNHTDYSLKQLERHDLERVLGWRNADHVRAYMYHDELISWQDHERWYHRVMADPSCDYRLFCYHNEPVGLSSASQIDRRSGKCFWGLYIGAQNVPPGSGLWLGYHALNHMVLELGMRKVICEAFAFNSRAIHLYEKLGFREEGVFKRHVLKNGEYKDVVSLALFDEQWRQIGRQLLQDEDS